jgi:hypothetical protein
MDSDEMRERARQCRAKSETAADFQSKAALVETAETWEKLATQYDDLGPLGQGWLDQHTKRA